MTKPEPGSIRAFIKDFSPYILMALFFFGNAVKDKYFSKIDIVTTSQAKIIERVDALEKSEIRYDEQKKTMLDRLKRIEDWMEKLNGKLERITGG